MLSDVNVLILFSFIAYHEGEKIIENVEKDRGKTGWTVESAVGPKPLNSIIMVPPAFAVLAELFSCELLKVISIKLSSIPLIV